MLPMAFSGCIMVMALVPADKPVTLDRFMKTYYKIVVSFCKKRPVNSGAFCGLAAGILIGLRVRRTLVPMVRKPANTARTESHS